MPEPFGTTLGRLFATVGPVAGVLLIGIVLVAGLILLDTVLHYGERGVKLLLPLVKDLLLRLISETKKSHPALKVEMWLHVLLILIFFLSFAALISHELIVTFARALLGSVVQPNEKFFEAMIVSSFLICIGLGCISYRLACRLP